LIDLAAKRDQAHTGGDIFAHNGTSFPIFSLFYHFMCARSTLGAEILYFCLKKGQT